MGSEWKSVPFRELYAIPSRNGLTKPKKIRGEGYKFINMGEIFSYGRMLNIECDRAPATDKELETSTLKAGDLLFARQSLVLSGAGKCSIFLGDDETTIFESHLIRVRPDAKQVLPEYLYYYFDSPIGRSEIWSITEQGAGQAGIRGSDLETVLVRLPSLAKQEKIVSILQAIDNKIALNRQINTTLESMAQALFKSWFVDFDPVIDNALAAGHEIPDALQKRAARREALRQQTNKTANETTVATDAASSEQALPETGLSDQRLPPEIQQLFPDRFVFTDEMGWVPEGWEVKPLSEALCINPKVSIKKGTEATYVDMKALPTSGFMIDEAIKKEFSGGAKFKNRDVLLARITPCLENGKTGLVDFLSDDEAGFGSTEFIVLREKGSITMPFIAALSRHPEFRHHCVLNMVGSSGRQRVQNSCFDSYFVSTPTDSELLELFDKVCSPYFTKMAKCRDEARNLANLRDSLLPKLLSGQITIPDAEQQLAEVL